MHEETPTNIKIRSVDDKIDNLQDILLQKLNEQTVWIQNINDKLFDLKTDTSKHDTQLLHLDRIVSNMQKSLEIMRNIQRENEKDIIQTKLSSEEKVSITSVAAIISTVVATIVDKLTWGLKWQ